jgi:DNA-binding IclR family transcriptional regulator
LSRNPSKRIIININSGGHWNCYEICDDVGMVRISKKGNTPVKVKSVKRSSTLGDKPVPVRSITRTAGILRCLSRNIDSVKNIAEECGLSMATTHRILQALEYEGFAFHSPVDRKYYLGPMFTKLQLNQTIAHQHLLIQSIDEIKRLWNLFGEFTALDVEVGLQVITLVEKQSRFNYSIAGPFTSTYYGSLAKVLMAQKSDDVIKLIMENITPEPKSKHCVTDKDKLMEEFRMVRRQGYSISRKENTEGMTGISVPVHNYHFPAALSIVGPEVRLESIIDDAIPEMITSAKRISDKIAEYVKDI